MGTDDETNLADADGRRPPRDRTPWNVAEQHGAYMMNYYNGSSETDCWKRPTAPTPTTVPLGKQLVRGCRAAEVFDSNASFGW